MAVLPVVCQGSVCVTKKQVAVSIKTVIILYGSVSSKAGVCGSFLLICYHQNETGKTKVAMNPI